MSKSTRNTNLTIAFAFVPGQQPLINVVKEPDDQGESRADKDGNAKNGNISYFDEEEIKKMVQKYVSENFAAGVGNKRAPILITGVTTIKRSR